jgi:Fe-S-cluster-containing hydrogenase component 2
MQRIFLDLIKCTGCRVCEAICSLVHEDEFNPTKSRIKVVRTVDNSVVYSLPVFCLQCEEAHCAEVCPTHAITRDNGGVLLIDEGKCIGCKLCEIACPVGAVSVHPEKRVAIKCDLCRALDEPQCVRYCFPQALSLLPAEQVGIRSARARADKFVEMQKGV